MITIEKIHSWLDTYSQFFTLLPILFGLIAIKKFKKQEIFILLLLVYGLAVDITYYKVTQQTHDLLYSIYGLIEALCFLYFMLYYADSLVLRKLLRFFVIAIIIFWLSVHFLPLEIFQKQDPKRPIFDLTYEVFISGFSAFMLLKLAEKEKALTSQSVFWFLFGIFLYCFCTFFIVGMIATPYQDELWNIHNFIDIIKYLLFSIGFVVLIRSKATSQV